MRSLALAALIMLSACTSGSHGATSQPAAISSEVCAAYRAQRSNVEITTSGTVVKVLGVYNGPSGAHENFLVATSPATGCRLTLRVAHNVDIARRIPLAPGEAVTLHGEYIYDSRGGIMHWTHRDPRGRHQGGYVEANGERYD